MGGYAFLKGIFEADNQYFLVMDQDFFPYGNKTKEFLTKRSIYLINYLFNVKKVDRVILACNTLSIMALPFLKELYYDKVMGVMELIPANIKNSVFVGTKNSCRFYKGNTYDGSYLIDLIQKNNYQEEDVKNLCDTLDSFDILILGCTHFIHVKDMFRKYKKVVSQDEEFLKVTPY